MIFDPRLGRFENMPTILVGLSPTPHHPCYKQTFYLQKVEARKVTLGTLKYMFCVQLYGKWAHWGCYNLYFEALKGLHVITQKRTFFKNFF